MTAQKTLATLLRNLAERIERSSAADMEAFLQGEVERLFPEIGIQRHHSDNYRRGVPKKRARPAQKDLSKLAEQLQQLESRNDGLSLLYNSELTRKDLEQLARVMDLPVLREDDAERLRHKIVEASIGSRLNSQAIRGA
jgi:hypothetical protein